MLSHDNEKGKWKKGKGGRPTEGAIDPQLAPE
jgi:hypothetical protein